MSLDIIIHHSVSSKLLGDPLRISQILINLLSNAVKFTHDGGITIEVSQDKEFIRILVTDSGIGLTESQIKTIFDAFTQADSSTTRKYGGSGLGLAISNQLAQLMGGQLHVRSNFGRGSSFELSLPLQNIQSELQETASTSVIVVSNNEVLRKAFAELAIRIGCRLQIFTPSQLAHQIRQDTARDWLSQIDVAIWADKIPEESVRRRMLELVESGYSVPKAVLLLNKYRPKLIKKLADSPLTPVQCPIRPSDMIAILGGEVQRFSSKSVQAAERVQRPQYRTQCKVLIVEDNPINQQVAAEMLKKMGCGVSLAENGQVALERCQENDFDLIFMDMQMPVMDGLQATKALRNLDQTRHIPIIAMTANVMKGDKERCLQAGMNDYIGKPVRKEDIRNKLEQWLGIKILDNSSGKNRRSNLGIGMEKLQIFDDPELAKEIIELFVDNHGNDALQLKKLALKDRDYISLLKVAHKLKGSAAELNLPELSQLCENIRTACETNDFAEVERIVNKIETELENSIKKLKRYVTTLAKH